MVCYCQVITAAAADDDDDDADADCVDRSRMDISRTASTKCATSPISSAAPSSVRCCYAPTSLIVNNIVVINSTCNCFDISLQWPSSVNLIKRISCSEAILMSGAIQKRVFIQLVILQERGPPGSWLLMCSIKLSYLLYLLDN